MNELPERIKQRLYQLLELATRGVGGERKNAESRIEALLERYGVNRDDFFETESVEEFYFTFNNKFEKRLFIQIAASVEVENVYSYKYSKQLSVKCTVAKHAEIKIKYSVYRKALKDEFDMTFEAFLHSQKIYSPSLENEQGDAPLSPEEYLRVKPIADRAMMMEHVDVHSGIELNESPKAGA